MLNRKYNLKLDLQFRCNNSNMEFNQFDKNTSDFFIQINRSGKEMDLSKALVTLMVIKPNGNVDSQFLEVVEGGVCANLKPSLKDIPGDYQCKAIVTIKDETVILDQVFTYTVNEDKFLAAFNQNMTSNEDYTLLTDILGRLSTVETDEQQRQINEAERILNEESRKVAENTRVEAELVREHNDADREKAEATRESNEFIRKTSENNRVEAEVNRVKAETNRVDAEALRVEAENLRNDNYNFMISDEERRRNEENARIEAEKLRKQAESTRVNQESQRRTTEQARVLKENERNSNEISREANEVSRKSNEEKRVQAEANRSNRYDNFITDAESAASNFKAYTSTAKQEEEARKNNELARIEIEDRRVSNEVKRISDENTRKANENRRVEAETIRQSKFDAKIVEVNNKVQEVSVTKNTIVADTKKAIDKMTNDFNSLSASQQQDAEVVLARDGEESLNARLKRDLEKGKLVVETLEGAHISCNDTVDGIIKDIEVFGNTVQSPSNLSDIKSVGIDNGDGTYNVNVVSCGKNLANFEIEKGRYSPTTGEKWKDDVYLRSVDMIKCSHLQGKQVQFSFKYKGSLKTTVHFTQFDKNRKFIRDTYQANGNYTIPNDVAYVAFTLYVYLQEGQPQLVDITDIQLEEGVKVTPFEECKQSKCTIKLPCQLEKVGDIADRLYFDKVENAWCIDKIVMTYKKQVSHITRSYNKMDTTTMWYIGKKDLGGNIYAPRHGVVSNLGKRADNTNTVYNKDIDGAIAINADDSMSFQIRLSNSIADGNKYLDDNKLTVKCVRNELQKIVLPLDAQIMLNQFLGTTNAWLECGEVDGTIKATFSKSIASTVQANTKAINDMDNRIKGIEGLKESQDMAYATDKGCLVCKETKNGTIKDLKISGKSFNNLCPNFEINYVASSDFDGFEYVAQSCDKGAKRHILQDIEPNTQYTIMCNVISLGDSGFYRLNNIDDSAVFGDLLECKRTGFHVFYVTSKAELTSTQSKALRCQNKNCRGNVHIKDIMILKGHIQKPPSYFEGIASVGNGVDKIEVSSVNGGGNLLNYLNPFNSSTANHVISNGDISVECTRENTWSYSRFDVVNISPEDSYYITCDSVEAPQYSGIKITDINTNKVLLDVNTIIEGKYYLIKNSDTDKIRIALYSNNATKPKSTTIYRKLRLVKKEQPYKAYEQDKKPVLFKDADGNWKPIAELRGLDTVCDTIELHSDGKYYYHQRTNKTTLNELSAINLCSNMQVEGYLTVQMTIGDYVKSMGIGTIMSEKYKVGIDKAELSEGIYCKDNYLGYSIIAIRILNSKANTVEAFKQYLQTNNDTLIYQLEKEKIFEVNPLFLEAFEGETMVSVNSGVINAPMEFKLTSTITNLMRNLQLRVDNLENDIYKSQELQDIMLLENDLRLMDLEFALLESMPMKLNLRSDVMFSRGVTEFEFLKKRIESGSHTDDYLEKCINKYKKAGRLTDEEYDILYDMIYPPVYDVLAEK